jgi:hypothetical protein
MKLKQLNIFDFARIEKEREALGKAIKEERAKAKRRREAYEKKLGKKAGGNLKRLFEKMQRENFEIIVE